MKLFNRYIGLALIGVATLSSCQDEVLDQKPQASLDASTAFTDAASARAGLLGIYSNIQSANYYGLNFVIFSDLYADNLAWTGTFPTYAQIANKQVIPSNVDVTNTWNSIYSAINRANTLIGAVPNINDGALDKNAALAEARTLRAFLYFDLLRFWGGSPDGYNKSGGLGVPLVTTPTLVEADATPKARSTEAEVYTQILADLDFAIGTTTYGNTIATTVGTGRARMGKNAAKALKARVQLYRGEWASAEALASEVISTGGYTLVPNASYGSIWSAKNTSESIFELQFDTQNTTNLVFYYYPTTAGGRNEVNASADLNGSYETGDVRKAINYTTIAPLRVTTKYSRIGTRDDNVTLIRLSEMYLIRAEARARQANLTGALADINVIRLRAGVSAFASTSQADILTQILKENRNEFAHEAHRYFDLRRFNQTSVLGITQTFRNLWPIPEREVLNSGGVITQNPGY